MAEGSVRRSAVPGIVFPVNGAHRESAGTRRAGRKSCMIRLFPCVGLASTQTGQGSETGTKCITGRSAAPGEADIREIYIHYRIFQLSLNISLVHNMPVSSISPLEK
jgi:hypothetical protein